MEDGEQKVVVVPCSGIGKSFGSVAREAGYELCDILRPDTTRLLALSKLVLGEEESRVLLRRIPAITIDGCKFMCAAKLVKMCGGTIEQEVAVLDVYRRNKELKPEGIAELNEHGKQLAHIIAEELAKAVDGLGAESVKGGDHA